MSFRPCQKLVCEKASEMIHMLIFRDEAICAIEHFAGAAQLRDEHLIVFHLLRYYETLVRCKCFVAVDYSGDLNRVEFVLFCGQYATLLVQS